MSETIALFDGNSLVHRGYHAIKPLTTSRGEMTNAVFGFTAMLIKAFADLHPNMGAVAFDKSAPTFRHEAYVDYKANRQRMADDLRPQFERVRQIVAAFGMPIYELAGYEADDLLGTLARQAVEQGVDVVVVTGDTDALQLVAPHVRVLVPSRGMTDAVLYDEQAVRDRYGLEPIQIIDYKALKGDPSDNIKGIPGVGEKTAQRLLGRYGTIERLIELPDDLDPKLRPAVEANVEALKVGKQLTTIRQDAPIQLDLKAARLDRQDRARLIALMRELEFRSLIERLPAQRGAAPAKAKQTSMFDEEGTGAQGRPPLGDYRTAASDPELDALLAQLRAAETFALNTQTTQPGSTTAPLIGLAFSTKPETGWYVPYSEERLARLRPLLEDPKPKVGHNLKVDAEVLNRYGVQLRGIDFDAMIAAFVIDTSQRVFALKDLAWSRLGVEIQDPVDLVGKGKSQISLADVEEDATACYACAHADVVLRLKPILEQELAREQVSHVFREIEMPCVPVIARMEEAGIAIDVGYFGEMSRELAGKLAAVEQEIYGCCGHQFNIGSPLQLGQVLFEELKLPRGRKTRTGWSTDAETLEELRGVHPIVDLLFEYRQLAKLKSTYVDALPTMVAPDGRVHTSFNQIGAHTGRLSSSEPNLQNIPIRTELGRAVRRGFIAGGPGLVLLGADYSQVELRILAHITRDEALLAAFKAKLDIHRATAATIFNLPPEAVTGDQRRLAKVVNFGIAYGLGAYGLSVQAGISQNEATQFIRSYLDRYTGIARYIEEIKRTAEEKGYVETIMGRRIRIPDIVSVNRAVRSAAERRAINAPIQGSNADFMKVAMSRVDAALTERGLRTRLILQVHDELVFEAPREEVEQVQGIVGGIMTGVYPLDPPLEVEFKVGENWCDVE